MTRVFRQSYTAQHQFRPRFFATPDPIDGVVNELLDNVTVDAAGASGAAGTLTLTLANSTLDADGTFTDATTPEPPAGITHRPLPMPRTGGTGRTVRLQLTANLGALTSHTTPRVEFADEELIEIV